MKPTLRLAFVDFWSGFVATDNFFVRLLSNRFRVVLDDEPEFVFYSGFGRQHRQFGCTRIFYTGENVRPDFTACDYALTFDHLDHPRHYRLPLYVLQRDAASLIKDETLDLRAELARKTRFCNFVYSNPRCRTRNRFYQRLSRYRTVDAGGRLYNNLGSICDGQQKIELLRSSKFTIAFENSSYPGYTTEKLTHAMRAQSLPIYWGNPSVARDFNPRSFLNAHEFSSQKALVRRVMELDQDDDLYLQYLREPWFHDNRPSRWYDRSALLDWFEQLFRDPQPPVATQPVNLQQRLRRGQYRLRRNLGRVWRDLTRLVP